MAFQARHRWMIQKIGNAFGIEDDMQIEDAMRQEGCLETIDALLKPGGPTKIFFFFQARDLLGPDGEVLSGTGPPELFLCDGEEVQLRGTAIYFMRMKDAGEIDPSKSGDGALTFGTVDSDPLRSLETVISSLYTPLLQSCQNWGEATSEQTSDFLEGVRSLSEQLQESLKSMETGLELRKPDRAYNIEAGQLAMLATDPEAVAHFSSLLEEWSLHTEAYLDESGRERFESQDAGPDTELEFWRRRMQRLSGITKQLQSRECKAVIGVLTAVTRQQEDLGFDRALVFSMLRRWKQIDMNITEAANEARDNVKYLGTLERFIEPLYKEGPPAVVDALPALLNAIKMIHTIARYYNTTERMTKLFAKITNQMVNNCKLAVNGGGPADAIWSRDPQQLIEALESSLHLNEAYQEQYRLVKDKLLTTPKGKQFDFNEQHIFGKFDRFCRRVIKLIDLFSTIHQFQQLAAHALEGMEGLCEKFAAIYEDFKGQGHNVLDFNDSRFDRDYVEFNVRISDLEDELQLFINNSFESISSIEASLNLLKRFQIILQRETLRNDLDSKFGLIFHNYGLDLHHVQDLYEKERHAPPMPRNMPPVAGNIMWSRHLLKRIEEPMRKFESNPKVLSTKESKKIVKSYNKVARTLVAFEYLWYQAWCKAIEQAKAGLQATLLIRHPDTGRLFVNFDQEILQLVREAKCLDRMGIEIPDSAKMVLLQEDRFKSHFNELSFVLREHSRVMNKIAPVVARLLTPHVVDLEHLLKPAMVSLSWTSMNIDAFTQAFHTGLQKLEQLINNINDIIENRIDKSLKEMMRHVLVDLPSDEAFTLDGFVNRQERHVRAMAEQRAAKNTDVENAVEDLITLVTAFPLTSGSDTDGVSEMEVEAVRSHYSHLLYRAILNSVTNSLFAIKERCGSRGGATGFLFLERPFFQVDVQLAVPSVRLSPGIDDVQHAINRACLVVLQSATTLYKWGQQSLPPQDRATFYDDLGCDVKVVKTVLLLSGAMQRLKQQVKETLADFAIYDWLWKEDMELEYSRFMRTEPTMADFEDELRKFMEVEAEINSISSVQNISCLSLFTQNLKLQLRNECRLWRVQYSEKLHQQARLALTELTQYIKSTGKRLEHKVTDLESLKYLIAVLKEVRERESTVEFEIHPVLDMYQMLESYLPAGTIEHEEMDQQSVLRNSWRRLADRAEEVTDMLSDVQGKFKTSLMQDIKDFAEDSIKWKKNWELNGPMVPNIKPADAVERLNRFKDQLNTREHKLTVFAAGEELFALPSTQFPEMQATKKQIGLSDQLYGLYTDVLTKLAEYRDLLWTDIGSNIDDMLETVASFDSRCKRMPKRLQEWEAYDELKRRVADFMDIVPIVQELSKPSIMPRHWKEVMELTNTQFPVDSEEFKLESLLDCDQLLENKEEIEELCDGADKQLKIEQKLREIREKYDVEKFDFVTWKGRNCPVLSGFVLVIEELEDAQLQLQGMLSMRHVTPFREPCTDTLTELSNTVDTLELWVKVQMSWQALESVFTGGDIAKQLPLEAKKFAKVDKDWLKLMAKAAGTMNVVQCCANEVLRNTLPVLYGELEKCQKSLDGYLEQKRMSFPRFYFVSNPVLLAILSKGSDPLQVLPYYEKIFDSITSVEHDPKDSSKVYKMGGDEHIPFSKMVLCKGNVEDWLTAIETEMQVTMKVLCEKAAVECRGDLRTFVDNTCGQFALLGVQLNWTVDCTTALEQCKTNKRAMQDTNKQQLGVLSELSSWCLQDLGSKMNRKKIETLVTIQVHQRDVFNDLTRLFKERKVHGPGDFDWLQQARFYWRPEAEDQHGPGACVISICDVDFKYSFEYLGCKERLVITPLTDRCYITLSQALGMYFGGAPAGPAGTGKTETTKDMGRALGIFVVVTNCTDQQRYTDMAKIFKGLCQAGLWGCFDEFNRIELPVLSVVAQQVLAITNAKRTNSPTFCFPGDPAVVRLIPAVGYFITMNPGYAGRQELPENLKALFRGVTMMVPDREIIMKVKLCSVGYSTFTELARKFATLYRLCEEQLSKQKHYDFGLRNILSVLRTAGKTKRDNLEAEEDMLLMTTLRDMNLSKMVADDTPLFLSLLKDLFPGVQDESSASSASRAVMDAARRTVVSNKQIPHPSWMLKVNQLYDTTLVRHGIMLVGPPGAGKSEILTTLRAALTETMGIQHKQVMMNPKAIRAEEMFGETDKMSGEWVDGIFAAIWSKCNDRTVKHNIWIVCDGPVDAVWIENLNTVLDDNKILTLANGDRIAMTDNVKIMFEVEDLRNASPATVSRAGIIYVSDSDLDWEPVTRSWLGKRPEEQQKPLGEFFEKYMGHSTGQDVGEAFGFVRRELKPVLNCSRVGQTEGLLSLLESLLGIAELSESAEDLKSELERVFLFSLSWSLGGLMGLEDRAKFDEWLRAHCPDNMPSMPKDAKDHENATIFEFCVNLETMEWEPVTPPKWKYPAKKSSDELNFSNMLVPTADSTCAVTLMKALHRLRKPVLMVGEPGTAKTVTAQLFFDKELGSQLLKNINFSSATTPGMFQGSIEAELDKRGGKNFGPPAGKAMTVFLDDLGMPEVNTWGDQPTLEIVRQLVQNGQVCFLDKDKRGDIKNIEDLSFIAAMNPPGSGKNDIPARMKRQFFVFNMLLPTFASIDNIYGQMLRGRFPTGEHKKVFNDFVGKLSSATIKFWSWMKKSFLPTPAKFHYVFNLRDISRVFQGILRTPKDNITNEKVLLKLWRHECERVFSDKLTSLEDKDKCGASLDVHMQENFVKLSKKEQQAEPAIFVDFLRDDEYDEDGVLVREAPKEYELSTAAIVRERVDMYAGLYNEENPATQMHLILFDEALGHLLRLTRTLGTARGNMLLVGVGGSGKQSLTRLASFISRHLTFQITLSKSYNEAALMDDLRMLYKHCGQAGKTATFLFTEAEIKEEGFLEYVNSVLSTGEIAGLFPKDELTIMAAELRNEAVKKIPNFKDTPANLVKYFWGRARDNLHIVLCFSPVGPKFAERSRKFPGLINGTTIDWFLPWSEEALVTVSGGFIQDFAMECTDEVRAQLIQHMGTAHSSTTTVCTEYFDQMRRNVYQTPKSYLSFIAAFKAMYTTNLKEIKIKERNVALGLQKIAQGAEDVEAMKLVLADKEVELKEADRAAGEMLKELEVSSMEAKKEADGVQKIKESCESDAALVTEEKKAAEADLAKAQPYLDKAEAAVQSIKPNDLNELKKLGKPSDIIKLTFDCVCILRLQPLSETAQASITMGIGKEKRTFDFIADSFPLAKAGMLADTRFLQQIFHFSKVEKDKINDETVEFLMPYLDIEEFQPAVAKNASVAAEGLCQWVKAMVEYTGVAKVVRPKLEALALAEGRLEAAQLQLDKAAEKLQRVQKVLSDLQQDFEEMMASKGKIEANAQATRDKMTQATNLINGLGGERLRWMEDQKTFASNKIKLVGDCVVACAFLAYCGPFDAPFRKYLISDKFIADINARNVPMTEGLDEKLDSFLSDQAVISDWNLQGLPTDSLSTANGILVTRSSRYPLLIDPQGQALRWIQQKEADNMPAFGATTLADPRLRDRVEFCMSEGKSLILASVEEEVDPMLTPLLEKQIITKAKSKYITLSDKLCEYNDEFMLYMTTRLPNPHFSPELQARTTVVNFTVTQDGLAEQLLARVIGKEQRSLEEQLNTVMTTVAENTKALITLDAQLLTKLTENDGNLLDDVELIAVLAQTKKKAVEVNEKLIAADAMKKGIDEKREQYRPVAIRGSVLYFIIIDMSLVNCMYQTSLDQFLGKFEESMDLAEKATLAQRRVNNIIDTMTYTVYRYINRGLYEKDKLSYVLMCSLKILQNAGHLEAAELNSLLKGGAALDIKSIRKKPYAWLSDASWMNVVQLAADSRALKGLPDSIGRNEAAWKRWYDDNEPEELPIPDLEALLTNDLDSGAFRRLLVIRCVREDRTILGVKKFLKATETVEVDGVRLSAMGSKYVDPVTDTTESILDDMEAARPVIYLLSAGADPTDSIEQLSKRKRQTVQCVSMGEGQEPVALNAITMAMANGSWVLLQNCHLGLGFMDGMEDLLAKIRDNCNPKFRLFITSEPHPKFPIGLLHLSLKVTNEPPAGLRAGLLRSYSVMVDQEKLERIDNAQYRSLIYGLCFLHTVVQERRKFGALGWCIPYEYNNSDLSAGLTFLEKHMYAGAISWPTLQYMVSEVTYGGKITDNLDRRLFNSYCEQWVGPPTLTPAFSFNPDTPVSKIPGDFVYSIPQARDLKEFKEFISGFPEIDSPEVSGMHPNADLTFRTKEVTGLLSTILETQPKQSAAAGGMSREDVVLQKAAELVDKLPVDYVEDAYKERIVVYMGGLDVPLNIFLFQEIQRFQMVVGLVRHMLVVLQQAIRGEVVMTPELVQALNAIYDARVPPTWLHNAGGDEISWMSPTLGLWFGILTQREEQYRSWLDNRRPYSFWLTGFFNPQGFLTATKQEVTRKHVQEGETWALDDVVYHTEVTEFVKASQVRQSPKEGVFVHGLFLDAAGWDMGEGTLVESEPKVLYAALPILWVTGVTKATAKSRSGDYGPYGGYECPCYKYPNRGDRYLVFYVTLPSRDHRPRHWALRGAALLCSKE